MMTFKSWSGLRLSAFAARALARVWRPADMPDFVEEIKVRCGLVAVRRCEAWNWESYREEAYDLYRETLDTRYRIAALAAQIGDIVAEGICEGGIQEDDWREVIEAGAADLALLLAAYVPDVAAFALTAAFPRASKLPQDVQDAAVMALLVDNYDVAYDIVRRRTHAQAA